MTIYCNPGNSFFECWAEMFGCPEQEVRDFFAVIPEDREERFQQVVKWSKNHKKIKEYCHRCSTS